jgi:hypothetical protein
MVTLQALTELDRQAFLGEDIHDRQRPKTPAVNELIGHEIHAPGLIGLCRHLA